MSQKINFADYPASGVYFIEIDNSIITGTTIQSAHRIAVGFNMQGPFNRPVYISNTAECNKLFGGIDRKLERRGCFTNRNVRTMLQKSPVYVLNLLNVNTANSETNPDTVGYVLLSLDPRFDSYKGKTPYANIYDRTRFWIADDQAFVRNSFETGSELMRQDASQLITDAAHSALFGVANCGTKDISVIVKKSENTQGYNVTFLDYFGNQDDIPYSWISPNDFVSDYFVDVILIAGNWGSDNYASFADDVVWSNYFTDEGLMKSKLAKFLRLDAVNVLGSWTGCLLPNFMDHQGNIRSIDYLVNQKCNETGLVFAVNHKALDMIALDASVHTYFYDNVGDGVYNEGTDTSALFIPDLTGYRIDASTSNEFMYLSAKCSKSKCIATYKTKADPNIDASTMFTVVDSSGNVDYGKNINIGDYVRMANGMMAKIIGKRGCVVDGSNAFRFTASDVVLGSTQVTDIEIHHSFADIYDTLEVFDLAGLKLCNRHMPGYDSSGNTNLEAGIEKIYAMLEDQGIRRGLLNDNMIDFRYIVDTMAYGLGDQCRAKLHLANLAKDKQHCTALINAPSMTQFAESDEPFFGADYNETDDDPRPMFDIAYIPEGGNTNLIYDPDTEFFSLPDFDNGADHVGVFSPFFKYKERQRTLLVPPAADVSNTFMNKFLGGDPYKTVANMNGIINNPQIAGLEFDFDTPDRGYLEPFGINPIISRNGNILIYGDRTAYQTVNSDLSFLHVRELLNTIQISCKAVLDEYVFTYNIPTTRAEIVTRISPILDAMQQSGALVKYEIECDDFNNTKDVIDNKFCIVDIGVWVSQNMEKIVVPITLNRSTTA